MGYKKVVTGLALALGAVAAPMDTQANSETNAEPKVTAAEKAKLSPAKKRVSAKKAFIPAWVPVTEEYGLFDREKAEAQAEMLWSNHGKDIQEFMDNFCLALPGSPAEKKAEKAFNDFAHKLAKGDKEKEKEILDLHDSLAILYMRRHGKAHDTLSEKYSMPILLGFLGAAIALGAFSKPKETLRAAAVLAAIGCGTVKVSSMINSKLDDTEGKHVFMEIQKDAYDEWSKKFERHQITQEVLNREVQDKAAAK